LIKFTREICTIGILLSASTVSASGFFINQQSIPGLGRADAGNVAAANDLGTVFFNPAGMTALWRDGNQKRTLSSVGVHLIVPRSDLDNMGSTAITPGTLGSPVPLVGVNTNDPSDPTPILNAYLARQLSNERLVLGFRLNSPFGLAAEYPTDWFGRYDSTKAELLTVDIGAAIAYQINDQVSIGGGIDVQYAESTLVASIPNPLVPGGPTPETDGRISIEGDNWDVGFNIGLLAYVGENSRVGIHYRSAREHDLSGNATTSGLTAPLDVFNGTVGASANLNLPAILSLGFAWEPPASAMTIYGDYTWYGWSDLDTTRIEFADGSPAVDRIANFRDTYTVALGLDFGWTERFTLRGGAKYDQTPTVDEFRDTTFADNDRFWLTVGGTYQQSDTFAVDFAIVHTFVDDTSVNLTRTFFGGTPLASVIQTSGSVKSTVNTFSIGIRKSF
jgi:long-chain fatty acid transport protein